MEFILILFKGQFKFLQLLGLFWSCLKDNSNFYNFCVYTYSNSSSNPVKIGLKVGIIAQQLASLEPTLLISSVNEAEPCWGLASFAPGLAEASPVVVGSLVDIG